LELDALVVCLGLPIKLELRDRDNEVGPKTQVPESEEELSCTICKQEAERMGDGAILHS